MSKITVCKDCQERFLGCHSTCERYKQDKARNEEFKHKIKLEREIFDFSKEQRLEHGARCLRKYGKLKK